MKKIISVFGIRPEDVKMTSWVNVRKSDSRFSSKVAATSQRRGMPDQALAVFDITPIFLIR